MSWKGFSKASFATFDKIIELAEMGEDVESIARTAKISGATVKAIIKIEQATKEGRIVSHLIDRIPRDE